MSTGITPAARVYVGGHRGLLGSAVLRRLHSGGYLDLLVRTSAELDLRDRGAVRAFFDNERPGAVFLCAAKVGGIQANIDAPADFLLQNLLIQCNVIEASHDFGVEHLLFVASSCIYPTTAPVPLREESILTGPLEPTNEGYALAKSAGIRLLQYLHRQHGRRYIPAIPPNLFGIGDHYDPRSSHLLPALIRRVAEARVSGAEEITLWGTGKPRREFMLSDDCADALVFLMENGAGPSPINVGIGEDATVEELAMAVSRTIGHPLRMRFDSTKPDGMLRKLLDSSSLFAMGWRPRHSLEKGIRIAWDDFRSRFPGLVP